MIDVKQIKKELAQAALDGVLQYMVTTRGAHMLGARAEAIIVPDTNTVQVKVMDPARALPVL